MDFRVLGPLEIAGPDGLVDLGAPKQRTLAALLLCRAGTPISADALVAALWNDHAPRSARKNLQVYVYQLRKAFAAVGAPDRLHHVHSGYCLTVEPGELDIDRFSDLFGKGRTELAAGEVERAARVLGQALSLWRGEPFADLPDVEALQRQGRSWQERRLVAEEARIEADLRRGRHTEVVDELFCLVRTHPLHEQFRAQLMTALLLGERKTEALAVYDHGRQVLAAELGIAPGANLARMHEAALTGEVPAIYTGAVRTAPVRVVPRQLPRSISDFVGRAPELALLQDRLAEAARGGWPLLVLTGAAGVGKSTLAVKAAHAAAAHFPDGQLYVDLAEHDGGDALARMLRALGCAAHELPAGRCERQALYRTIVADKSVLVVLDNAANESQVRSLLPGSACSATIVTSRSRLLGLDSAQLVEVPAFHREESVQLLLSCSGPAEPDSTRHAIAIAEVCDQLPLAVRVAGVRAAQRSLRDLARRLVTGRNPLDELVAGDESVRGRLTASYRELDEDGRTALRRLGTLGPGEFAPWVLAALLGTHTGRAERSLDLLLDRHFVRQIDSSESSARFVLPPLTHHFATEVSQEPVVPQLS
ncbi:AfsR/SARP family transcriptional regulator [Allokutzneria oryzae]|uniref:BTAD domain-containing putative transcriptional regulator n=1 Tax=Allokutzneria oryzae TaxID=1378989 RepID=A0ABV6A4T2_9PSEU